MTKKKKSTSNGAGAINGPAFEKSATPSTPDASPHVNTLQPVAKSKSPDPSTSALIICRNKHWRCNRRL